MARLVTVAKFALTDVLPFTCRGRDLPTYILYKIGDLVLKVRMQSCRYDAFRKSSSCVCCGVPGAYMALEYFTGNRTKNLGHFNMYAIDGQGEPILMTKDHIIPVSKGGTNHPDNLQTLCAVCNNLKGDFLLSLDQLKELYVYKLQLEQTLGCGRRKRAVLLQMKANELVGEENERIARAS